MAFNLKLIPPPADNLRVIVAGYEFTEWFNVDLDSDVFSPADGFEFTGVVPDSRTKLEAFREGARVDIYVGEDRQMAGVVDSVKINGTPGQTRITIAGRDLGAYLVDSESEAFEFSNYTIKSLAEKLLRPEWGIREIVISNDDNRKVLLGREEKQHFQKGASQEDKTSKSREKIKIDPGQSCASILDEQTRRLGLTWWMTADGKLFIGKPQYKQDPAFEFYAYLADKDRNKTTGMTWSIDRQLSGRCSEFVVNGYAQTRLFTEQSANEAKARKCTGSAQDTDLVKRGIERKQVITDHDALSDDECRQHAEAEMGKRRLGALVINLMVPEYRQGRRLYTIDCLAKVVLEEADIDGVFWISQRRFKEERNERRTTLTLHEKGVWLP